MYSDVVKVKDLLICFREKIEFNSYRVVIALFCYIRHPALLLILPGHEDNLLCGHNAAEARHEIREILFPVSTSLFLIPGARFPEIQNAH